MFSITRRTSKVNLHSTVLFRHLLCLVFPLFVTLNSFTQSDAFLSEYYSINDGLSDRLVKSIIQNEEGFLWLATSNGLNKFDGYEFTIYDDHPANSRQISEVNTDFIAEDAQGNIIITYRNNYFLIDLLNPRTNEVKKINLLPGYGIMGIVRDIQMSPDRELEILSNHNDTLKIYRLLPDHNFELVLQFYQEHVNKTSPLSFTKLLNGNYLINDTEYGLAIVDQQGKRVKEFNTEHFECLEEDFTFPASTNILHQDQLGRIWVSFVQIPGVYLYHEKRGQFELLHGHETGYYTALWQDNFGNILLPKTTGIGAYPTVLELYCITNQNTIEDFSHIISIGSQIVTIYSQDFFKTLFIGMDTGLKIVQNNKNKIKTYLTKHIKEGERGLVMRGITGDGNGTIYFAREVSNWYALDTETQLLDTITLKHPQTAVNIDFNCCMDIYYEDGILWGISCQKSAYAQLIKYHIEEDSVELFIYEQQLTAFVKSRDGKFWLTYRSTDKKGGLVSFDPRTETWEKYKNQDDLNPFKEIQPSYIMESSDDMLWVASDNGLFKVDRTKNQTTLYQMPTESGKKGLLSNNIYVIVEDAYKSLWIGSSNGLNRMNPQNEQIESYDKSNGLANNQVCGIVADENGNFWISTYNGLSYFDTYSKLFKNFYKTDGLSDDEFNRFSFYKDENDTYYFGGVNGMNVFKKEDLLTDEAIPPLVLTKLTKYNSRKDTLIVMTSNLNHIDELVISPYDTYFQLNFSLPKYVQSEKNQFVSKLEGLENNWNYLGNNPQVRYNNLPAGNYTLLLKGADPNGNWHGIPYSVKIRVIPVFYKTLTARIIMAVLLALLIWGVFQYQLEQRLKVEKLRTKISSDLHDEVSGLLSGIAMQTDVLKEISKDETSKSRLQNIGEVSRMAMTKMSDVIWSIDSRKDKVEDLIHRMQEHAEDILSPLNINYAFEIGKIDRGKKLPVDIRQNLYFIFKEAINNVVKHSKATEVVVQLGNQGQKFELKIQDNGLGKMTQNNAAKSKKTGQGLSNLKMRAQRINALLDIIQQDGYIVKLEMKKFA